MRRVIDVLPAGGWTETAQVATATLPFVARYRRRVQLIDDEGQPFLLDLERAAVVNDGEGLLLEAGGVIAVRAACEDVIEVSAADPAMRARLAWHLGNRHTPVQILADGTLRLHHDPVIAAMLQRLGATVVRCRAPFDPEAGAYTTQRPHHHGEAVADGAPEHAR